MSIASLNTTASPQVQLPCFQETLVTIYQNTTQFSDYFKTTVSGPQATLVYGDLLPSMRDQSAFITLEEAQGEIVSHSIEKTQFALGQYIQGLVGKEVTLINHYGTHISGTFLGQDTKTYTLFSQEGQGQLIIVPKESIAFIQSENLKEAISLKPSFKAEYITGQSQEEIAGQILYLARELMWQPCYRLILEETEQGLYGKWLSEAQITNLSDREFKNLMVRVVAGQLNEETGMPIPQPCYREMKMLSANAISSDTAIEQNWQDLKAYFIAQKVSLKPKEMLSTRLYNPSEAKVEKTYILKSYEYQNGLRHPSICYTIENSKENQMHHAFPAGVVQVYQKGQHSLDYIGSPQLTQTPQGENLKVMTGESFDLGVKRMVQTEAIRDILGKVVAHEVTVSFELTNNSEQDQSVFLHEHINNGRILNQNIQPIWDITTQEWVFKVDVLKNTSSKEPQIFSYTYRKDLI